MPGVFSNRLTFTSIPKKKLPLSQQLAARQAKTVLFCAFIIGLSISLVQISSDYWNQKQDFKGTLAQLTESIRQPATNSVWFIDTTLAEGVIDGLLGYEPILSAKLTYEGGVLLEKSRPDRDDNLSPLSLYLFGDIYTINIELFSPEESEKPVGHILLEVNPSYVWASFLKRSFIIVFSGVAKTVLLSCALLMVFYATLTRPVLAVSRFVREFTPGESHRTLQGYKASKLQGELGSLYEDTKELMSSVDTLTGDLEGLVEQRTRQWEIAKQTLDCVSACVMSVDKSLKITYLNPPLLALFRRNHAHLSNISSHEEVERFLADIVTQSDALKSHLSGQAEQQTLEVSVGRVIYILNIQQLKHSDTGARIGHTIEWRDRTEEKHAEEHIQQAVASASSGQLHSRLNIRSENPFFRYLSQEFNNLLSVNERVLSEVNEALFALSCGKLNQSIHNDYQGAFLELKNHVNSTIEKLRDVIGKIHQAAQTVNYGSQGIIEVNHALSQHNQLLDQRLCHTIEDIQSLTHTVAANAQSVVQADTLARNAKQKAEHGAESNHSVVTAISELQSTSERISNITQVINDIAFQTNLLSLNAAVEAAHAGEKGKGFAVVAAEVQSLSIRSSDSAREIDQLVKDSRLKVKACRDMVDTSDELLKGIVEASEQVSLEVEKISSASHQQTHKIRDVNTVVTDLHQSAEHIRGLVESASDTSQKMADCSDHLNDLMAFFKDPNSVLEDRHRHHG